MIAGKSVSNTVFLVQTSVAPEGEAVNMAVGRSTTLIIVRP